MAHPQILRPQLHKGVNYFDLNYHRGRGLVPRALPGARRPTPGPGSSTPAGTTWSTRWRAERIVRDLPEVQASSRWCATRSSAPTRPTSTSWRVASSGRRRSAAPWSSRTPGWTGEIERMRRRPGVPELQPPAPRLPRAAASTPDCWSRSSTGLGPRPRCWSWRASRSSPSPRRSTARIVDFLGVAGVHARDVRPLQRAARARVWTPRSRRAARRTTKPHDEALGELLGHEPFWRGGAMDDAPRCRVLGDYVEHVRRHWRRLDGHSAARRRSSGTALFFSLPHRYYATSRVALSPQLTYLSLNTDAGEATARSRWTPRPRCSVRTTAHGEIGEAMQVTPAEADDSMVDLRQAGVAGAGRPGPRATPRSQAVAGPTPPPRPC